MDLFDTHDLDTRDTYVALMHTLGSDDEGCSRSKGLLAACVVVIAKLTSSSIEQVVEDVRRTAASPEGDLLLASILESL